jgi:glycerate 2-kinase
MNDAVLAEQAARAMRFFEAGVAAADPYAAVSDALKDAPLDGSPTLVIAFGKAAHAMASAAQKIVPDITRMIVVTNPENAKPLTGAEVHASAHPVPDAAGLAAGQAVISALRGLPAKNRVLALISGGGSALLPAPAGALTLEDKQAVNAGLLASGAPIEEINLVRQQLSQLKGGGFVQLAAPSPVTALILSDVIGDDLRAIASGPTTDPLGTRDEAIALLRRYDLWETVPEAVQIRLSSDGEAPAPVDCDNRLIGSNPISVAAMAAIDADAQVVTKPLIGDVTDAALAVAKLGLGTHLLGGETTVQLTGTGRGGRNQDLALRVALLAEAEGWTAPWTYLQAGTDGRDGPTDAAGGIVNDQTLDRIRAAGIKPQEMLDNNDAYPALKAADALVMTGGTGTNVADLGVLIRT